MNEETMAYKEIEVKFRSDIADLTRFCLLCDKLPNLVEYASVTGPDEYYIKEEKFIRYRKESHKGPNGRAELTTKTKPDGAKNNIVRTEYNVRVDGTPPDAVRGMIGTLGFQLDFIINKHCWIYRFEDANVVFYTVSDVTDGKARDERAFIEIEVDEEKLHHMTLDQAQQVIKKYEEALEPLGINAYKRVRKSLFETYSRK